ncbi:MAG: GDP-mannose 4,6-dehydratase [Anaerolineaceae bacterium]
MNWKGKKVLVTGAGGFIGSHLVEALVEMGAEVRAFVHYNALGSWGWLDTSSLKNSIEVFAGDICDRDSVSSAVKGRKVIFHLAALIAIPYSYHAPASYVRTNIEGTLNILQAAREQGIDRMIHTSTSEVYGSARVVPIPETHPLQGQSPYSASKIGADKMAEAFHLSFGLPVVTVRPFNTFGPRQSGRAVIPTIISQCLAGNPIKLGNLHPTRDLNYVSNTTAGFIKAAESKHAVGKTYNLGSGREISIGDLAELIIGLTGNKTAVESDQTRMRPDGSEVERLLADASLANKELGWKPEIDLEEGLKRTIAWINANQERFRPDVYTL